MDFDKFKGLNYQEKNKFNQFFNSPKVQSELFKGLENRKFNFLLIVIQCIIFIVLLTYFSFSTGNFKAAFIATLFFSIILSFLSRVYFKKIGLDNILTEILKRSLREEIKFSTKITYFKDAILKLHKNTKLLAGYDDGESPFHTVKYTFGHRYELNNSYQINGIVIHYLSDKETKNKVLIKISSNKILSNNIIRVTNRRNTLKRVGKLILFFFIGGILSLLSFVLIGLIFIDFNFNLSVLEILFVIFALALPGGTLGVWSNFKNQLMHPDLIKFSNHDFNKIYDIYCEDHNVVHEIFNDNIIDTILKYGKMMNKQFNMYIYENEMYIEFDINEHYLNFYFLSNPYKESNYVEKYIKVKNIIGFTDELLQGIDTTD